MNPTNPTPNHSPLVPQGSIPPKTTSRSSQVLLIAATVVFFHVAGFAVVLMQGCQKDNKTAGTTSLETNGTAGLSLPAIGDTNAMFSTGAPASTISTQAPVVAYTPPTGAVTQGQPPAATAPLTLSEPPTSVPTTETPLSDYKVASGDTLSKIASKHHITVKAILNANPNLDPKKLQAGKTIKIPAVPLPEGTASAPATTTASTAPAAATGPSAIASSGSHGGGAVYVVRSGDTLTKIAKSNGITVAQLRSANNMKTTRVLVGQKLKIPARSAAAAPAGTTPQ